MEISTEHTILNAAKEIFIKKGYSGARMQEIADAAGINKAMLHYYFRSKDKLFQVILEQSMGQLIPKVARSFEKEGSVTEKFEFLITNYVQTIRENPHLPIFILHELSQNRTEFLLRLKENISHFPNFQLFFQQITEEIQSGKIRQFDPIHLLLNIISMCVFPFIAKPVVTNLIGLPDSLFDQMMLIREKEVTAFMKSALQP